MSRTAFEAAFDDPRIFLSPTLEIRLIGHPEVIRAGQVSYRPRSRKSWAVLCYLLLSELPPTRAHVSAMLFSEAKDPMRALRWSLSEIRRLLGSDARLDGDPIAFHIPEETSVDVQLITLGRWQDAISLPTLGGQLLHGFDFPDSPYFESWLLAERRHTSAATEDVLREACLAHLGRGDALSAIPLAVSLVGLNPYVENHQALLIRSYALSGDSQAAERQLRACAELYAKELGVSPGPAIRAAALTRPERPFESVSDDAVRAAVEAGNAALAAGAVEAGVNSLRLAMALADSGDNAELQARARLSLAESLIHSVRGDDDEGAELLHGAVEIARGSDLADVESTARVELGYTDMLGGRYDRAQRWLNPRYLIDPDRETAIKALTYLGVVQSDRARYNRSKDLLEDAADQARSAQLRRREAYAVSMLGRMSFLLGDLDGACEVLADSVGMAETDGWLAFLPWPQAFLGEALVEKGDLDAASRMLRQAFARACQIGDPCWEGVTGRALAVLSAAAGDQEEASRVARDALERCRRLPDTYKWAEAYVLEAKCELGVVDGNDSAREWIEELFEIATRTGMREIQLKALDLQGRIGDQADVTARRDLVTNISNPRFTQ